MSLYPYVCKYFKLSIRHRVIHVGYACFHQDSKYNGVRLVSKLCHIKYLVFKRTMFTHRNIHKCTCTPLMARLTTILTTY